MSSPGNGKRRSPAKSGASQNHQQQQEQTSTTPIVSPDAVARQFIDIPVNEIGLDPRPERQIRPLDPNQVRHLADETDPAQWQPIDVRSWPPTDPYPPGEEGRPWQVVSGYHRTSAARALGMPTIRAQVVDAPDDATFTLVALRGNTRHGKPMSNEEVRTVVRRLAEMGVSQGQIARETGIAKATVSAWVTGRDTNAAAKARAAGNGNAHAPISGLESSESINRQLGGDRYTDLGSGARERDARHPYFHDDGQPVSDRERVQAGIAVSNAFALNLPGLRPAAVAAWMQTQDEATRWRYAAHSDVLQGWLLSFAVHYRRPPSPEEQKQQAEFSRMIWAALSGNGNDGEGAAS